MNTKGRAFYHLLRMNWLEDQSIPVKKWQVEDLRSCTIKDLFDRLHFLAISIDKQHFFEYAEAVSTPEELAEVLCLEEKNEEKFEQIYLLVFELWRKLLPEKQSLSIFCDELDYLIDAYEQKQFVKEEILQEALADLERFLDEYVDKGIDPKQIFAEVSEYCAHDLESFIFDYISDQLEEDSLYASELIEGFRLYVEDAKWFDFLRFRIMLETNTSEAETMLERLLEQLQEQPDLALLIEISRFLIDKGMMHLFLQTIRQARPLIQTEEDLKYLFEVSAEFFRLLNQEEIQKKVHSLLKSREKKKPEAKIRAKDQILTQFYSLFENLDGSEV